MSKEVLIVDDSATVRKFVSVSLSMQGFTVVTACDGMDVATELPHAATSQDAMTTDQNRRCPMVFTAPPLCPLLPIARSVVRTGGSQGV